MSFCRSMTTSALLLIRYPSMIFSFRFGIFSSLSPVSIIRDLPIRYPIESEHRCAPPAAVPTKLRHRHSIIHYRDFPVLSPKERGRRPPPHISALRINACDRDDQTIYRFDLFCDPAPSTGRSAITFKYSSAVKHSLVQRQFAKEIRHK